MHPKLYKLLVLCGAIGPIYFALSLLILGSMFPGYNHVHDFISELGAVDSPVMSEANFLSYFVIGVFLILYSIAVFKAFANLNRNSGKIAAVLMLITGIGITTIGFFPCDPACVNFSATGNMHEIVSTYPFYILMVSFLLLAYEGYKGYIFNKRWTIFIIIIIIITAFFGALYSEFESGFGGLFQRIAYASSLLFMLLSSVHLYRHEFRKKLK
jgi:hypothetical membrane protein